MSVQIKGTSHLIDAMKKEPFAVKMLFNENAVIIFPYITQYSDVDEFGLSYKNGTAMAAIIEKNDISIAFNNKYSDKQILNIIRKLIKIPELNSFKDYEIFYHGHLILTNKANFKLVFNKEHIINKCNNQELENIFSCHNISIDSLNFTEKTLELKNNFDYEIAKKHKNNFENIGLSCAIEPELVPFFKEGPLPSTKKETYYNPSNTQNSFYEYLKDQIDSGNYPSVDGNICYLYMYTQNMLRKYIRSHSKKKYNHIQENLIKLAEVYCHENNFAYSAKRWAIDCLLGMERYEEFLKITEPKEPYIFSINTYENNQRCSIKYHIGKPIGAIEIMNRYSRYTQYTRKHYKDFIGILENILSEEENNNGSLAVRLLNKNMKKSDFCPGLFSGAYISKPRLKFICYDFCSSPLFEKFIPDLIRKGENLLRETHGVPKIGEGWVSETELYYTIKNAFPQTQIIQHGRPLWLGKQHLDIWIPDWKIAIEYHGTQHFEPVYFFGGIEGHEATKKRDARKEILCKANNVELIIAKEDTIPEQIIEIIENIKESKNR